MQNILLLAPYPPPNGGIANWTKLLLDFAQTKQNDVHLQLVDIAPKRRATEGRGIVERIVEGGTSMLRIRKQAAAYIHESHPDCIHLCTSGSLAVLRDLLLLQLAKAKKIPVVYHLHFGRVPQICKQNTREWHLIKKAMQMASCVIGIDALTVDCIRKELPSVRCEQFPNPFDFGQIADVQTEKTQADTVVFVGWVVAEKGIGELVGAWKKLAQKYPQKKLKIIGPYHEDYVQSLHLQDIESVQLTGEMTHEDVLREVAQCGLFILPSYTEGFPNAVLEAMALETPVLATDVGAMGEMLASDCGLLFTSCSEQAVYDALCFAFENEAQMRLFARNAKTKTEERYALEKVFEKYKQLWCEVKNEPVRKNH